MAEEARGCQISAAVELEGGSERFPIFNPRVWTLENVKGSPVYNGPATARFLAKQELEEVERFLAERRISE
jgi:hypothetical protein